MVMYWCKNKKTAGKAVMAVVVTALFLCCTPSPKERTIKREAHFDIPAYFNAEIARLTKENPTIDKTVIKDSLSETREIQIADWETELSSFVSIDLNKPVYTGILEKDSTANKIKITSSDPKIDISSVEIEYNENGVPIEFRIQRNIENSLYKTHETLRYTQNKGYSLEKHQSVLVLGEKYYHIEGVFNP